MANELSSQLDSSELVQHSSIELTYPEIPIPTSLDGLLSHSISTNMANETQLDTHDNALSESWATLSDADYSFDDELRSETTDAASLIDNAGSDDVHSIGDQPSDAGSQDAQSDPEMSQELLPQNPSLESTKTLCKDREGTLKGSYLARPIELEQPEGQAQSDYGEATQVVHVFSGKEATEVTGEDSCGKEHSQIVGSVCMTILRDCLNLDNPFRLLYIGNISARAGILAKIGDILMAGHGRQRPHQRLDSSRYHVVEPPHVSDSSLNYPELIRIDTQLLVDDCTTAASIKDQQSPDQIFLGLKNGSMYSSRWNGTTFELCSASEWSKPDLAIFFLAHDDDPMMKQRHKLAHAFASRHLIPTLIIAESTSWSSGFNDLSVDGGSPHLRVDAQMIHDPEVVSTLRRLPIDLDIFECLDSVQLNRNFAYLRNRGSAELANETLMKAATPSSDCPDKRSPAKREAIYSTSTRPISWHTLCTDVPMLRSLILTMVGLVFLAMGLVACKIALTIFMNILGRAGGVSELSPATAWTLQTSSTPTVLGEVPSILPTTSAAVVTSSKAASKGLVTINTPSDLAELITSKSLHVANKSENFQVHGIGDCHIVVKTPRGFKHKNKSAPFEVIVARGSQILDSSVSKLFDGVYTMRLDKEEAYGLLNVTIRRSKTALLEEHQVDFGAQWLKVAGWKKAAQIASDQVRNDLDTAQVALSMAYDHLHEDVRFKANGVSKKAAREVKKFSKQSRLFLNSTAKLLKAKSNQLRHATKHEREDAYKVLSKRADLAFQALVIRAHTTNKRGRAVMERILTAAGQTAEHIQQNAPQVELGDVQNKIQEYMRSERLAKAQERAKQIVEDTSSSWRQRRASRRAKRAGCGKKGRGWNR
jgi:hypothetical protein